MESKGIIYKQGFPGLQLYFLSFLVIMAFSTDSLTGQTYGSLPMGGAGFVSGIVYSKTEPGLRYARTDVGGAYRWDKDSGRWIALNEWCSANETGLLGVESIALDPSDPDKLYMSLGISYFNGGKSAIYRSSDRGKTFSLADVTSQFKIHGNGMGRNTGEKLAVDPNIGTVLFCGSRDKGLFKSSDAGTTWVHVSSLPVASTSTGNGISLVLFDPASGTSGTPTQTLVVGVSAPGDNLYRSDDAGENFYLVPGAPANLMPGRAALDGNGNIFISYLNAAGPWDPSTGQIWKYNISTGNWTSVTPAGYNLPYGGISVDPADPMRIVASTINIYRSQGGGQWGDLIFISNDGGNSWINKTSSGFKPDPNGIEWAKNGISIHWAGCIEFDPFNTKRVSVISGNGIFTTENIDSTVNVWKFDVKGLEETVPMDLASIENGPVISVVGDYDGCRFNDIKKYGSRHNPSMGTTVGLAFASLDPAKVVRAGSRIYYSEDTAKTWKLATINGNQGYVALSSDGKILLHTPENSATTYRSTDMGSTWESVPGLAYNGLKTVADAVNSNLFYAYHPSGGRVYVSVDGGKSFFASGSAGNGGSRNIVAVPGKEGHIYIALYGGGLTRSVNGGSSFSKIKNVTHCSAVGIGKSLPGSGYQTVFIWGTVDGIEGLYFSTDEGLSWNRINDENHEWGGPGNAQFVIGDKNTPGLVYMSTAGLGIIYAQPDFMLYTPELSIPVGGTTQVRDTILSNEDISWTWSSGDTLVAKVSSSGLVTGISEGTAVITAGAGDGRATSLAVTVEVPVTGLSVSPVIDSLAVGASAQLTATIIPSDATSQKVTWSSLNPGIATVSSAGLVRGIKTGITVISAVSGTNYVVQIPLIVGIPLEGISINPPGATMHIMEQLQLGAILSPENTTDTKVTWKSDQNSVAAVSSSGLVTAKATGSAVITASSSDGTKVANCLIRVEDYPAAVNKPAFDADGITIYPNPLKEKILTLELKEWTNETNVTIYNVLGRKILENNSGNEPVIKLNISVEPGIYMIKIERDEKSFVKKLIVEK